MSRHHRPRDDATGFTASTSEGRDAVIAQQPIGRPGTPEEISAAVLWLCSDEAASVLGHAIFIPGDQTAPRALSADTQGLRQATRLLAGSAHPSTGRRHSARQRWKG